MEIKDEIGLSIMNSPEWLLVNECGKPVCSFIPTVVKVTIGCNTPGTKKIVSLRLLFKDDEHLDLDVDFDDLDAIQWSKIDSRCIINSHYRGARIYIANLIRASMDKAPSEDKPFLSHLGINHIGDNIVFFAGDRVIIPSSINTNESDYIWCQTYFHLDIDENISKREAFDGLVELMNLCPEISHFLLAHTVAGIIRAAFEEVRFTPNTVLSIIGRSGTLKSHYVPHMVQLYNRSEYIGPTTRFNSTNRFIEDALCDYRECTAVIDDIHSGESKSIMRANKNTAEDIVRRVGDNTGRGRKEGSESVQRQFHGNVVFIGEYKFGKDSTVPRMLMLNIVKAPDGGILDKYQRKQPLLVSTFYYYFIQWYVENFNDICSLIDTKLSEFRVQNGQASEHKRFLDTQFYLQISYWFFLEYCKASGFCSEEESKRLYSNFEERLIQVILQNQAQLDDNDDPSKDADYLKIIRKIYCDDKFNLASDIKHFNPDVHDGLIHNECLCLRGEKVDEKIRKKIYNAERKDWVKFLQGKNALKIEGGGKKAIQIYGSHGMRFYAIYLHKLK